MSYPGVIERFREYLPLDAECRAVTLLEGNTPLIPLSNITADLPIPVQIWVKFEGLNPTCSFKDRGMTAAVSQAVYEGTEAVICASTGNTSAAAAAYAARAGINAFVIIPDGQIALGKLAQAMMYGAQVLQINGNFDQGLEIVKAVANDLPITLVNSVNPYRIEGQKTAAFEIIEVLGDAPDYHALPVGNAGNITAYWRGYQTYHHADKSTQCPQMLGYQASGAAPFIVGHPIDAPETVATAIRIGNPQSWQEAMTAQQESQGWFDHLSDEDILRAQGELAAREGIFCEPASAASIGGVLRDVRHGKIAANSRIVCTLTGHGLKDPQVAIEQCQDKLHHVECDYTAVEQLIKQHLSSPS